MAFTVISANYPPQIDPTKVPLAYGDRALPKINRELQDPTLLTRQRALMSLCDALHDPERIAEALEVGIPKSLKNLLTDEDTTVRQKATECLSIIAGHSIGRDAFLDQDVVAPLSNLFDDPIDIARINVHKAIEIIAETSHGAAGIVAANLIPQLVVKLQTELDQVKDLILETLHFCTRLNTEQAIEAGAMEIYKDLLTHPIPIIRAKAARDIQDLSVPLAGKIKAVKVHALTALVSALKDESMDVRAKAAGAISSITITTEGKKRAILDGALKNLLLLVNDGNSEVRLNALKSLTCLSEAPEGRRYLLRHVDQIRILTSLDSERSGAVRRAAEIAVKVITWKPGCEKYYYT